VVSVQPASTIRDQHAHLTMMMRGNYAYYGISGNTKRLRRYAYQVVRICASFLRTGTAQSPPVTEEAPPLKQVASSENEILVPAGCSSQNPNGDVAQTLVPLKQRPFRGFPSIEVDRRTAIMAQSPTNIPERCVPKTSSQIDLGAFPKSGIELTARAGAFPKSGIELIARAGGEQERAVEKLGQQHPANHSVSVARRVATPLRTVAKHGISGPEIERLDGAVRFMQKYCQSRRARLWWLTVNKDSTRNEIAAIQKRTTRLQVLENLPSYNVTTFETRGGLHAHIIFIGNHEVARRLENSAAFGDIVKVATVRNPDGLVRRYLVKERTPQSGYRREHMLGGRIGGSHRLEGGGDRVRLSRELKRHAIRAGWVMPWQPTNAMRSPVRKPYSPRRPRLKPVVAQLLPRELIR
jgi:hypothetical protein